MQKVTLIGNLGKDPVMRYAPSGDAVTSFSVATSEKWTDKSGEKMERTTWWTINAWGKMGEACNAYLTKGKKVYVEGAMVCDSKTGGPRLWTRNDGTTGASFEVKALKVEFLSSKNDSTATTDDGQPEPGQTISGDSIPF